jgi:hypothetical protein
MSAKGFGKTHAVASNETPQGRAHEFGPAAIFADRFKRCAM